jgi:hypothetical protein
VLIIVGVVVGALVLLIVVAAAGLIVFASTDDDLATTEASDSMHAIVAAAEFDDDGGAALGACPLGSSDALVAAITGASDLPGLGAEVSQAYEGQDNANGVSCTRNAESGTGNEQVQQYAAGVGATTYDAELDRVFPEAQVDVQEQESFKGGEVYAYCVDAEEGPDGCGADWVVEDEDLVVGFYVAGQGGPTATEAADILRDQLPDMVDTLADSSPNLLS